jgi:hypothetical protein
MTISLAYDFVLCRRPLWFLWDENDVGSFTISAYILFSPAVKSLFSHLFLMTEMSRHSCQPFSYSGSNSHNINHTLYKCQNQIKFKNLQNNSKF